MTAQLLSLMRWVLWTAATCFGGVGMTYWFMSFRQPAAGFAIVHLAMGVVLLYAREKTPI